MKKFSRYSVLSLVTVPVGYSLLLIAREIWPINAGILNLIVGTVLTVPSFFMYRYFVWPESERSIGRELFSFWQTVMAGALASTALIALTDALFDASGLMIIAAGLAGQGLIFIARYFWLDRVTFRSSAG